MQRVALKIAVTSALAAGGTAWLLSAMSGPAYPALTALMTGAVVYAASVRILGRRIERITSVVDDLLEESTHGEGATYAQPRDELDRLVHSSDQALHAVRKRVGELRRADAFRRDYIGDVSHEIKTPIFAIRGFAETLLDGALDDPRVRRSFVEKIFNHAHRLDALARDLSELSGLETGAVKLLREPFRVVPIYEEVRDCLDLAAREKSIVVRLAVAAGAEYVLGDRERICQVLTNLAENAIKYTNPGGRVEIRAAVTAPGEVRLTVEDSGIGIDPEDLPRITERFYRAEKSRARSQGGSGLGLSIVKHILAAHGTTLHIDSRVGEGSLFSFTLPAANPEESAAILDGRVE